MFVLFNPLVEAIVIFGSIPNPKSLVSQDFRDHKIYISEWHSIFLNNFNYKVDNVCVLSSDVTQTREEVERILISSR